MSFCTEAQLEKDNAAVSHVRDLKRENEYLKDELNSRIKNSAHNEYDRPKYDVLQDDPDPDITEKFTREELILACVEENEQLRADNQNIVRI